MTNCVAVFCFNEKLVGAKATAWLSAYQGLVEMCHSAVTWQELDVHKKEIVIRLSDGRSWQELWICDEMSRFWGTSSPSIVSLGSLDISPARCQSATAVRSSQLLPVVVLGKLPADCCSSIAMGLSKVLTSSLKDFQLHSALPKAFLVLWTLKNRHHHLQCCDQCMRGNLACPDHIPSEI